MRTLISIVLHRDLSTTSNIKAMRLMVLSYPWRMGYIAEERQSLSGSSWYANSLEGENIINITTCFSKNEYRLIWTAGNTYYPDCCRLVAHCHLSSGRTCQTIQDGSRGFDIHRAWIQCCRRSYSKLYGHKLRLCLNADLGITTLMILSTLKIARYLMV